MQRHNERPHSEAQRRGLGVPERFYKDGPPHWLQGRNLRASETAAEARAARDLAVRRWRKAAASEAVSERARMLEDLAEAIEGCGPRRRCQRPACPLCMRARQRWFVWTAPVAVQMAVKAADDGLAVLSIVQSVRLASRSSTRHLAAQLTHISTALRRGLDRAGITFLVGGIDISANEAKPARRRATDGSSPKPRQCRYQLHLWGIGRASEIRAGDPALRQAFRRTSTVHRPVMIASFDGSLQGYAYALKTSFHRRVALGREAAASSHRDLELKSAALARRRNTRAKKLTVAQHAEVALLLQLLGARRLLLIGAHVTDADGEPVITPVG